MTAVDSMVRPDIGEARGWSDPRGIDGAGPVVGKGGVPGPDTEVAGQADV